MNISIIVPTLNASKYIEHLILSIFKQKNINFEILICDGGSKDNTIKLAKKYDNTKILNNPLKTAETGKRIGLLNAIYDYVIFLDSDNEIFDENYLYESLKILEEDKNIIFVEPYKFLFKKNDSLINKYCSIIGSNDPIDIYLDRFDKYSNYKKDILGIPYKIIKQDKIKTIYEIQNSKIFPTFGANGIVINKNNLLKKEKSNYYFDNDEILNIYLKNNNNIIFAKHKSEIAHYYCENLFKFIKKQSRRVRDFFYYHEKRIKNNTNILLFKLILLIVRSILIIPIIIDTLVIFFNSKKKESLLHPFYLYITLFIYTKYTIYALISKKLVYLNRDNW